MEINEIVQKCDRAFYMEKPINSIKKMKFSENYEILRKSREKGFYTKKGSKKGVFLVKKGIIFRVFLRFMGGFIMIQKKYDDFKKASCCPQLVFGFLRVPKKSKKKQF